MSQCPNCQKKISMSKAFCSRPCKEEYFHRLQIQMSPKFVRKNCWESTDSMLHENLEEFSKRHKWDPKLVKDAFVEKAKQLGYTFNYAVEFPKKIYGDDYSNYTNA